MTHLPPDEPPIIYTRDGYHIFDILLIAYDLTVLKGVTPEAWIDLIFGHAHKAYDAEMRASCEHGALALGGFVYETFELLCWADRRLCTLPQSLRGERQILRHELPLIETLLAVIEDMSPLSILHIRRRPLN